MKLQDIILWVVVLITVLVVLWYVFGNSPSFEQAVLALLLGLSITTLVKLRVLETRFNFLARDFREHSKKR
jgi:Mn2+/Fe2+ NRAMP family transporter